MVAVKPRERWYLYGNDVELADQLLRCDLAQATTVSERAWLLKHWPSLGGFDIAFDWLTQRDSPLLQDILGRATLLRIYQNRDDKNPWRAMVPPERMSEFVGFCEDLIDGDQIVDLWLSGGLGDQLECLAQVCDPKLKDWWPRLRLMLPHQSLTALRPFLSSHWLETLPKLQFQPGNPKSHDNRYWLSQMGWSFLLAQASLNPTAQILNRFAPDKSNSPALVCCWRSKIDPDDKHWAFLRSLPMSQIEFFYNRLVPWARSNGVNLIDITSYREDERKSLLRYQPALELVQPSIQNLSDTALIVRKSRGIITVDTALVHLASWYGWPTILLLHQFPDERWRNREMGLDRSHPIQLLQQSSYNCWELVRDDLLHTLAKWPWF